MARSRRPRGASTPDAVPPADASEAAGEPLVARARAGDADAFATLYELHAPRVYALCLRLTADPTDAGELVQDVFVRVWQKLGTFHGASRLSTWIHRVAVTTFLARQRASRRRHALVEPVMDLDDGASSARPDALDERLDLDTALAALAPGARTVFVLREIEGYDYHEISALTGVSEVALRSQLHRARKQIMEMLHR